MNTKSTAANRREETPEQREERLLYAREYNKKRRENETPEQREVRLVRNREYNKKRSENETPEQREVRLTKVRENNKKRRLEETPEEKELRLKNRRDYLNNNPEVRARAQEGSRRWYNKHKHGKVRENRIKNRDKNIKKMKKWRADNKDHVKNYNKEYRSMPEKKAKRCHLQQKREAIKKSAVLPDSDMEIIEGFFTERTRLNESSKDGTVYEVDHIVPIALGGSHHQDNLEIITQTENNMKRDEWNPKKYPKQDPNNPKLWANNDRARLCEALRFPQVEVTVEKNGYHKKGLKVMEDVEAATFIHVTHVWGWKNRSWINLKPNCMYNHSTVYENCEIRTTENGTKSIYTLKPMKKGEEILVDYTKDKDLEQPEEDWRP